ncbi:hypothetical protein EVG20_g2193 [Dentipellis fragilis]|uniref:Uncharacterized protein n=1 Tax=Dentipellis fragilis TaxID=205917 RepID=A0A4Y9Z7G5_9AGAM|nr:hypothetical protein EVG20_g2193 [Dentipellis fragilis]
MSSSIRTAQQMFLIAQKLERRCSMSERAATPQEARLSNGTDVRRTVGLGEKRMHIAGAVREAGEWERRHAAQQPDSCEPGDVSHGCGGGLPAMGVICGYGKKITLSDKDICGYEEEISLSDKGVAALGLSGRRNPSLHSTSQLPSIQKLHPFTAEHLDTSGPMPVTPRELEEAIRAGIAVQHLEIIDESSGCGDKYSVFIVSEAFQGKNTLARHRFVNELLKREIADMHAFTQVRARRTLIPGCLLTAAAYAENAHTRAVGGAESTGAQGLYLCCICLCIEIVLSDQAPEKLCRTAGRAETFRKRQKTRGRIDAAERSTMLSARLDILWRPRAAYHMTPRNLSTLLNQMALHTTTDTSDPAAAPIPSIAKPTSTAVIGRARSISKMAMAITPPLSLSARQLRPRNIQSQAPARTRARTDKPKKLVLSASRSSDDRCCHDRLATSRLYTAHRAAMKAGHHPTFSRPDSSVFLLPTVHLLTLDCTLAEDMPGIAKEKQREIALADENLLAELGYKQEFQRAFTPLEVFGIAFSIIGLLPSIASVLFYSIPNGGPSAMVWGWAVASVFILFVGMAMAELASAAPTSGGLYFWTHSLSSPRWRNLLAWMVGYANTVGSIAGVASIDWGAAVQVMAAASIGSDEAFSATSGQTYAVYVAIVLSHVVLCCLGTRVLARLQSVYVVLNVVLCLAVIVALPAATPKELRNSAKYALGNFSKSTDWPSGFAFILSFLAPLWTICSFDSSVHISEEASNAATAVPWAIVWAIAIAGLLGWAINVVLAFCMGTDLDSLINSPIGQPMAQIFLNSFGKKGTLVIWSFVVLVQRPVNTVFFVAACSLALALLAFAGEQAINAVFAISVTALYIAYGIPIAARWIWRKENGWRDGAFSLGVFSFPVSLIACLWMLFMSVVFFFPTNMETTAPEMNYTVVVLGGVMALSLVWYYLPVYGGVHWFTGPIATVEGHTVQGQWAAAPDQEEGDGDGREKRGAGSERTPSLDKERVATDVVPVDTA